MADWVGLLPSVATVVVPLMVLLMSKTCLQGVLALPNVKNVD